MVLKKRSKVYKDLILQIEKKFKLKYVYILSDDINTKYFQTLPECFRRISKYYKFVSKKLLKNTFLFQVHLEVISVKENSFIE